MERVLLVVHLMVALALVGVVLMQRSEGGGLGIGGGGIGGLMSVRGTANILTRATALLAAGFMVTSLVLAILSGGSRESRPIVNAPPTPAETAEEAPVPVVPLGD